MRYELKIEILNKDYVDNLIVSLVRQGYAVYLNEDEGLVCFEVSDTDLTRLEEKN
jgi:hypothetical protein